MYTIWTKHLIDDQKELFKNQVVGAKEVLERLRSILREEELQIERSELDVKCFEDPNWPYKQAYKNGQRSALQMMIKLIDLDQQEI